MRVALAGGGYLGARVFGALLGSRHDVAVLLQNKRLRHGTRNRWRQFAGRHLGGAGSVFSLARRAGLPVLWIDTMSEEELAPLRPIAPDVLLVCGFGIILKTPLLSLPNLGCINTHSSLLPKHRGPNPFAAAILAGDATTGVTFHIMDEGIDTGDILEQHEFALGPHDTALDVCFQAAEAAAEYVAAVLDKVEEQGLTGQPQDESAASYDERMTYENTWIDWRQPAAAIDRLVRAAALVPHAHFEHRGRDVFVTEAEFDDEPTAAEPGTIVSLDDGLRVATGRGTLLLRRAHVEIPFSWPWPPLMRPVQLGEVLP